MKTSKFDRRAGFFFGSAVLCALLIPLTLPKFRFVGEILTLMQAVLGLLCLADAAARRHTTPEP